MQVNTKIIKELTTRYPQLENLAGEILNAGECLIRCYNNGNKILICGNGGSCSDSDHIAGELIKGFEHKRPLPGELKNNLMQTDQERGTYLAEKLQYGLPAIALTAHTGLITAVANDIDADLIFAQQVIAYGKPGDVLMALSSSGNSQNVVDAILTAKAKGMKVIGLTGESGGKMKSLCDILINVPEKRTAFVQELHLPVYHTLCVMIENHFFGNFYYDALK